MTINKKLEASKIRNFTGGETGYHNFAYAGGRTEAVNRGCYRAGLRF